MKVLFVCTGNIGRSQIAEAFFNYYSLYNHAESAGINVLNNGELQSHRDAYNLLKCMSELGYNLSKKKPKQLTAEAVERASKVIVMTQQDHLPNYLKQPNKVETWDIPNPKGTTFQIHKDIRDLVKDKVQKLICQLEQRVVLD